MNPALPLVTKNLLTAGLLFLAVNCAADNAAQSPAAQLATEQISTAQISTDSSHSSLSSSASAAEVLEKNESAQEKQIPAESVAPISPVVEPATAPAAAPKAAPAASAPSYQNQTGYQNQSSPKIGSGAHLLNVTMGLVLIIGLIFGVSWFVKRFSQGTFAANNHLKVVAAMPLGTRERLVVVDAGGQQILLGITPTQINTLHVFEKPIVASPNDVGNSDFGKKLMAILQRPAAGETFNPSKNSGYRE